MPTNRWVTFGHHFAAIAAAGPLVGPILAAQFGYLPGLLWLLIGAVIGGAVHDAVVLFASMRQKASRFQKWLKRARTRRWFCTGLAMLLSLPLQWPVYLWSCYTPLRKILGVHSLLELPFRSQWG